MDRFLSRVAVAALLALLFFFSGCSALPPGLNISLRVSGSPLGVELGLSQAPTIIASGPDHFSVAPGATLTTQPATPATAPAPGPIGP